MEMSMDMVSILYKETFTVSKRLSLMTDSVILQFQKKNYEKDLLDQEKEREELLFLEMEQLEKEKHQNDGRLASDKSFEKKRECSVSPHAASELKITGEFRAFLGGS